MRRLPLLAAAALATLSVLPTGVSNAQTVTPKPARPEGIVPSGFTDTRVTNLISAPIAVKGLPDGRVVVLGKAGTVRIIQNGVLLTTPALTKTGVCSDSERGMLGFAADPDFGTNGLVYLYYTRTAASAPGGCVNRVSRFVMMGNTILPATEAVLIDNISSNAGNHNGGDLEVGNDGYLYVSVGDSGCDPRGDSGCAGANDAAQDVSLLNGKILRVDRFTGIAAPGNPISGPGTVDCRGRGNTPSTPTTPCREIYAYGLRNPWRFAFDPNTSATRFYINDVGQNTREEVDLGILGANYGWPIREGQCAQGQNPLCPPPDPGLGMTQPLTDYVHGTGDYITGGAFIPNGAWGSSFDGGYLFSDGDPGKIFYKPVAGATNYGSPFATGVAGVSDIGFVMDPTGWALYYVSPATNDVRKIVYDTTPTASPGNLAFAPVTPSVRAYDSRTIAGPGPLRAGTSRLVNVTAPSGTHKAALVNITLVRPTSTAFATAWQPRTTKPGSSNINVATQEVAANASIVPVDADGNVLVFVSATTHLVVDVLGFFDTTSGGASQAGRFQPVNPQRTADTRTPSDGDTNDYTRAIVGLDDVVNVPLAGRWGLPASSTAVALIVTGLSMGSPGAGYVVALPHGGTVPSSSNVNTNGGADVHANLVIVPVGADGSIDLRLRGTSNVLVDIVGSFTDGSAPSLPDGTFVMVQPTRTVDTRQALGFGRLAAGGTGTVNPAVVPDNALGVAHNIAIVNTSGYGYITAYPAGATLPVVSNGNATGAGQTRSVMALTKLGLSGGVSFKVTIATDVIEDVMGYFNGLSA